MVRFMRGLKSSLIIWTVLLLALVPAFSQPQEGARRWTVLDVLQTLSVSSTGKHLIAKAHDKALGMGGSLLDVIRPGDFSAIANDFAFRFNPQNPIQNLTQHRVTIFLDRRVNLSRAAVHLAHELTHFVRQEIKNPYDLNSPLNALETIVSTIEGKGGEVDAFVVGCQVFYELMQGLFRDVYCQDVTDAAGNIEREKVTAMYYQMGGDYQDFVDQLEKEGLASGDLPYLNSKQSQLVSEGIGMPCPLAALKEYQQQKEQVCSTHRRRLDLMDSASSAYRRLESLVDNYCL